MESHSSNTARAADSHERLGYVVALALAGLTTLLATPLLGRVGLENIVPLYFIGVVISTFGWGRGPGVTAAVASVLCFDVFFVPPRFSLTVAESESLITFGVMLVVSLVISHLTGALRRQALDAQARAAETALLYALTRDLGNARSLVELEATVNAALQAHMGASALLLLPDARHQLRPVEGGVEAVDELERLIARGVLASGLVAPVNPDLRDDALTLLLPLPGHDGPRGVLALHEPKASLRDVPDNLAAALALLVSAAVGRLTSAAAAPRGASSMETRATP
ncbi:MAG: DUF4118 domain-containing protein [Gammaproteobacteria bacterium]